MLGWARKSGLAAIVAALTVQPVMAESLSDALAMAYRTSGLIEQNRAVLRAADEDVAQAVAALRPVVNYTLGANYSNRMPNDGGSLAASLSVGLGLYDGDRRKLGIDAAKETVLATPGRVGGRGELGPAERGSRPILACADRRPLSNSARTMCDS